MGIDWKENLLNLGESWGMLKRITPKDQNLCNLRLSRGQFYGNKVNFFVLMATNWNHLSDIQVKAPHLGLK